MADMNSGDWFSGSNAHGRGRGRDGLTFLVLNLPAIDALFEEGGIVTRWTNALRREVESEARRLAPSRDSPFPSRVGQTEKLNRSIASSSTPVLGARRVAVNVRAEAKHALYVHEGTADPGAESIFPHSGRRLMFFDSRNGSPTAGTLYIIPSVEFAGASLRAFASLHGTGKIVGADFQTGSGSKRRMRAASHNKLGVRGQVANPFLREASDLALRARGIIR